MSINFKRYNNFKKNNTLSMLDIITHKNNEYISSNENREVHKTEYSVLSNKNTRIKIPINNKDNKLANLISEENRLKKLLKNKLIKTKTMLINEPNYAPSLIVKKSDKYKYETSSDSLINNSNQNLQNNINELNRLSYSKLNNTNLKSNMNNNFNIVKHKKNNKDFNSKLIKLSKKNSLISNMNEKFISNEFIYQNNKLKLNKPNSFNENKKKHLKFDNNILLTDNINSNNMLRRYTDFNNKIYKNYLNINKVVLSSFSKYNNLSKHETNNNIQVSKLVIDNECKTNRTQKNTMISNYNKNTFTNKILNSNDKLIENNAYTQTNYNNKSISKTIYNNNYNKSFASNQIINLNNNKNNQLNKRILPKRNATSIHVNNNTLKNIKSKHSKNTFIDKQSNIDLGFLNKKEKSIRKSLEKNKILLSSCNNDYKNFKNDIIYNSNSNSIINASKSSNIYLNKTLDIKNIKKNNDNSFVNHSKQLVYKLNQNNNNFNYDKKFSEEKAGLIKQIMLKDINFSKNRHFILDNNNKNYKISNNKGNIYYKSNFIITPKSDNKYIPLNNNCSNNKKLTNTNKSYKNNQECNNIESTLLNKSKGEQLKLELSNAYSPKNTEKSNLLKTNSLKIKPNNKQDINNNCNSLDDYEDEDNNYFEENCNNSLNNEIKKVKELAKRKENNIRKLKKINKVYDSLNDEEDEELEKIQDDYFVISYNSWFKIIWDFLIAVIVLYYVIYSPIVIAFNISSNSLRIIAIEILFEIFFILDIAVSFITTYMSNEELEIRNVSLISCKYIKTFLIIDLISGFPFRILKIIIESFINNYDCYSNLKNIFKISKQYNNIKQSYVYYWNIPLILFFIKCFKLIKITFAKNIKPFEFIKQIKNSFFSLFNYHLKDKNYFSNTFIYLFKFYSWFFLITHVASCIWIFIGFNNSPSWILGYDLIKKESGLLGLNNYQYEYYVNALYFHWCTVFTIGYGDVLSYTIYERIYNIILMLIGIGVYSYSVTAIGNLLSKMDLVTIKYNKNMNMLYDLRIKYDIKDSFYNKLRRYFQYDYLHNTSERFNFIEELPKKIKKDMLLNMHKDLINNLLIFTNIKDQDFLIKLVLYMRPIRVNRKEKLFDENEVVEEMYLVKKGILGLTLGEEWNYLKVLEIRRNEHFGDIFALSSQRTPYILKVSSKFADLMIIRKDDLIEISNEFPLIFENIFIKSKYNHLVMLELADQKKLHYIKSNKRNIINSEMVLDMYNKDNYISKTTNNSENLYKINNITNKLNKKTKVLDNESDISSNLDDLLSKNKIENEHIKIKSSSNSLSSSYFKKNKSNGFSNSNAIANFNNCKSNKIFDLASNNNINNEFYSNYINKLDSFNNQYNYNENKVLFKNSALNNNHKNLLNNSFNDTIKDSLNPKHITNTNFKARKSVIINNKFSFDNINLLNNASNINSFSNIMKNFKSNYNMNINNNKLDTKTNNNDNNINSTELIKSKILNNINNIAESANSSVLKKKKELENIFISPSKQNLNMKKLRKSIVVVSNLNNNLSELNNQDPVAMNLNLLKNFHNQHIENKKVTNNYNLNSNTFSKINNNMLNNIKEDTLSSNSLSSLRSNNKLNSLYSKKTFSKNKSNNKTCYVYKNRKSFNAQDYKYRKKTNKDSCSFKKNNFNTNISINNENDNQYNNKLINKFCKESLNSKSFNNLVDNNLFIKNFKKTSKPDIYQSYSNKDSSDSSIYSNSILKNNNSVHPINIINNFNNTLHINDYTKNDLCKLGLKDINIYKVLPKNDIKITNNSNLLDIENNCNKIQSKLKNIY